MPRRLVSPNDEMSNSMGRNLPRNPAPSMSSFDTDNSSAPSSVVSADFKSAWRFGPVTGMPNTPSVIDEDDAEHAVSNDEMLPRNTLRVTESKGSRPRVGPAPQGFEIHGGRKAINIRGQYDVLNPASQAGLKESLIITITKPW